MKRLASVVLVLVGIASFACSEPSSGPSSESVSKATNGASPSPEETPESPLKPEPPPKLAALVESLVIQGTANIFAAGRNSSELFAAGPGGGGAGSLPPGWRLGPGSARVVMFPSVAGRVNFWTGNVPWNGPAGDGVHPTDVSSYEGISGIVHRRNGSFLVGVFLTKAPPTDPAPPRLNVTKPPSTDSIAPRIGQVFLIGDGKDHRYIVPPKATRLFIGFADAMFWVGPPGYYGNNSGQLRATIALAKG